MISHPRLSKFNYALGILSRCIGQQGVWADPSRYQGQYWTRDLGIAIAPMLLRMGESQVVRAHLENLIAQQRATGQIPILFLEDVEAFVAEKERRERETGHPSFMLQRHRAGELWDLTPGTNDSEVLFIIAMYEYAIASGDSAFLKANMMSIRAALIYIERQLLVDGLLRGADWRDTMHEVLANEPLLTNNCLLVHAYRLMGKKEEAEALRDRIIEVHGKDGRFQDYPGNDRFDPLGGAFAVLFDVAHPYHYEGLTRRFQSVDTPHGVTILCKHNPLNADEAAVIERTGGVVVWPFVAGFVSLALRKMGRTAFADEQLEKLTRLDGFREWYDPANGEGYGAQEQLWSATLYLRAVMAGMPSKLF